MSFFGYWLIGGLPSIAALARAQHLFADPRGGSESRLLAWKLWAVVLLGPALLPSGYSAGSALPIGAAFLICLAVSESARLWPEADHPRAWRRAGCFARLSVTSSSLWFACRLWPSLIGSGLAWVGLGLVTLVALIDWGEARSSRSRRARAAWAREELWVAPWLIITLLILGAATPSLIGPTFASLSLACYFLVPCLLIAGLVNALMGNGMPVRLVAAAALILAAPLELGCPGEDHYLPGAIGEVLEARDLSEALQSRPFKGPVVVMECNDYAYEVFELSGENPRWWDPQRWRRADFMPSCLPRTQFSCISTLPH